MSTICKDITEYIESFAPKYLAEEWDNVGLLIGSKDLDIRKVLVCLDVTEKALTEAIEHGADMIVSHHPVIFKSLKRISKDDVKGSILYRLIQANMAVYSAHTNLDVSDEGINALLAEKFKLIDIENLKDYGTRIINSGNDDTGCLNKLPGLGKVGVLPECINLQKLTSAAKQYLNTPTIRVAGELTKQIKKAAIFCGSFDDDLGSLISHSIDVLITGEIKYHTVLDALEAGISVIEAGHFITENVIIDKLCNILSERFQDVKFIASKVKDPYSYI